MRYKTHDTTNFRCNKDNIIMHFLFGYNYLLKYVMYYNINAFNAFKLKRNTFN